MVKNIKLIISIKRTQFKMNLKYWREREFLKLFIRMNRGKPHKLLKIIKKKEIDNL